MLRLLLLIMLTVPVTAMALSDFMRRRINALWLPAVALLSVGYAVTEYGGEVAMENALLNLMLLLFLAGGIVVYLLVRCGGFINPLRSHIGLGDILFMVSITPLFSLRGYVLFLTVSMVMTLLVWGVVLPAIRVKSTSIPLVGTLGVALCGCVLFKIFGI